VTVFEHGHGTADFLDSEQSAVRDFGEVTRELGATVDPMRRARAEHTDSRCALLPLCPCVAFETPLVVELR
jgi:hypothetical protein